MKKRIIVGGIAVFTSLFFVAGSSAFAEEGSSDRETAITESSFLEATDSTLTTETTATEIEEEAMSLREVLLYFEHVPKELLDQITDEQIQEVDEIARKTFGAQKYNIVGKVIS